MMHCLERFLMRNHFEIYDKRCFISTLTRTDYLNR